MIIQRGAAGDDVHRIQQRLRDLKLYSGPLDSSFGGGTEAAVKSFQAGQHAPATGIVDAQTWSLLFEGESIPKPQLAASPVSERCLALTGSFETGGQPPDCFCGIAGDFDGQGISFGVLQWNLGQGTLQPLLKDMVDQHSDVCDFIFHENLETLTSLGAASRGEQLEFARSIQTKGRIHEPWMGMLKTLGRTPEFRAIQSDHAVKLLDQAKNMCREYQLTSQRALALMFDICTQNGSIGPIVKSQILADYAALPAGGADDAEVARMKSVANRRAAACRPEFVDDVRRRKLTIAEGTGTVHGIPYDLERVFGITLEPFA